MHAKALEPEAAEPGRADKRTYYHLFVANALALLGTGVAIVALSLLAYRIAGAEAGEVLGTALAIKMAAAILLAPVAGAFAERVPRRALLIRLDLLRAAVLLTLPWVDQIWEIFVLVFVFQAASAVFTPTYQAIVPDLLPAERDYTRALARSRLAYDLESVLSPMVATGLLLVLSFRGVFVIAVVGFLLSAVLILRVRLPAATHAHGGSVLERMTRGLRLFVGTPRLRALAALDLAAAAAVAMVTVNTVVVVQAGLGLGERATALALATYGAGALLATLAVPRLLEHVRDRSLMLGGAALAAAGLLLGPFVPYYGVLLLVWFALGVASAAAYVPAGAVLRRSSAREDRPCLYAAQFAISHGWLLVGYLAAGWLGAEVSLPFAFHFLGLLAAGAVVVAARFWPRDDGAPAARRPPSRSAVAWRTDAPLTG